VFASGTGAAHAAWNGWQPSGHDVLNIVRAAALAANAQNAQLFRSEQVSKQCRLRQVQVGAYRYSKLDREIIRLLYSGAVHPGDTKNDVTRAVTLK
jgi:hypothetical protein